MKKSKDKEKRLIMNIEQIRKRYSAEEIEKNMKKISEYILEKPFVDLSEVLYFYLLSLVPEGRLTRSQDINKYLAKQYGVSHVHLERPFKPDYDYWCRMIDRVPFHRVVSAYGYAEGLDHTKLLDEGFEFKEKRENRHRPQVKDYKKYLFDFEKETNISFETLQKINKELDF